MEVPRAILHNAEPEKFKPERFLNEDGTFRNDPTITLAFGTRKRICPVRHLVDETLFIVTTSLLSVISVTKARDENGHEIPVSPMVEVNTAIWCVALAPCVSRLDFTGRTITATP